MYRVYDRYGNLLIESVFDTEKRALAIIKKLDINYYLILTEEQYNYKFKQCAWGV